MFTSFYSHSKPLFSLPINFETIKNGAASQFWTLLCLWHWAFVGESLVDLDGAWHIILFIGCWFLLLIFLRRITYPFSFVYHFFPSAIIFHFTKKILLDLLYCLSRLTFL